MKTALVETLTYVTSTDQIVAFSVVSSRRRRLQQSTTTVSFSVRVEGSAEFAAGYAETIVSELSAAAQSGALNTALATAADDAGGSRRPRRERRITTTTRSWPRRWSTARRRRNRSPRHPRRRGGQRRSRSDSRPGGRRRGRPPPPPAWRRRTGPRTRARTRARTTSEDKGADSAGGGLAVLGIALAAFLGLLCVGGYVRMKMFGSQDRSDRDWARDLHGSGVSNPAAAARPARAGRRRSEGAASRWRRLHGLRSLPRCMHNRCGTQTRGQIRRRAGDGRAGPPRRRQVAGRRGLVAHGQRQEDDAHRLAQDGLLDGA